MSILVGGFLGGKKKVAWVNWVEICKPKESGGPGVKNLGGFNEALLGKWAWRLLEGKDALWARVLSSKYGDFMENVVECRGGKVRDRLWSSWWRDLVRLVGCRGWFGDGLSRVVGNGLSTKFWTVGWLGGLSLSELFPRLFSLEVDKNVVISDRFRLVEGVVVGCWEWRRSLFVWEEELLADLVALLNRFILNASVEDRWTWKFAKDGVYSVRAGYEQRMRENSPDGWQSKEWAQLVWNRWAPTKINCFIWRLILDRLPTRPNLKRRHILNEEEEVWCPLCEDNKEETVAHLFLECTFAEKVWKLVALWIGTDLNFSDEVLVSMSNFSKKVSRKKREIWMLFWHGAVWYIWKARNQAIFYGSKFSTEETFESLRFNLWTWFKEKDLILPGYKQTDWDRFPSDILQLDFS